MKKTTDAINPTKILILALIVLMAVTTNGASADALTFRDDGEGCPNGNQPAGWDIFEGTESGTILCTTSVKKVGTTSIAVTRDNLIRKNLPSTFVGVLSASLWFFPATDSNTNAALMLGHTATGVNTIGVRINESDQWFLSAGQVPLAPYSGTWTFVEMQIDTVNGTAAVSLDGVQVVTDEPVSLPQGINSLGVRSGRAGAGHTSYFDELVITSFDDDDDDDDDDDGGGF